MLEDGADVVGNGGDRAQVIFMEINVGFDGSVALDAAHHQQATRCVNVMFPFGDRALGFDLEE